MKDPSRIHIFVSGEVHAVGFRYSTREVAEKFGIKGFVKNLSDGKVEIVGEGRKENLLSLLEWARHGPPTALVTRCEFLWEEPRGEFKKFTVD